MLLVTPNVFLLQSYNMLSISFTFVFLSLLLSLHSFRGLLLLVFLWVFSFGVFYVLTSWYDCCSFSLFSLFSWLFTEQEGPSKLGKILAFATGASVIPPVGFSPQPSIDFLHDHSSSPRSCLPMANTCINCLKLPLFDKYGDFRERMDFAIGNTQGFGRE